MIAGFAGQDRPRRVLGIDASAKIGETRAQVTKIAQDTAERIGLGRPLRDDEITLLEGWAGDYYGIPVQSTLDAIRLTGRLEGMIIDPVYEGKSMAGLIDLVRTGEIGKDSHRALRPPGRPARAQRLQRPVQEWLSQERMTHHATRRRPGRRARTRPTSAGESEPDPETRTTATPATVHPTGTPPSPYPLGECRIHVVLTRDGSTRSAH